MSGWDHGSDVWEGVVVVPPNTALRLLRERTPSPATPGEPLSRQELADLINAQVLRSTERSGAVDANYIGKLERGRIVGWAAFDETRHREAGAAFAFALACTEQGGDWHLRAEVLSSMAREAIWRGDADTGLTWIELALVRADRLTATERAMLLPARARALALLGRVEETMRTVRAADTMRTVRAADERFRQANPGVDPPWMSYYDAAHFRRALAEVITPA